MAPNDREERRRMRQRGAGTTGVSIGNFGFTFGGPPAALPAQPSARRTPRALPSQPSSRRTPSANPLPAQRSARRTPASTTSRRTSAANPLPAQRSSRISPAPPSSRASSRRTFKREPTDEGSSLSLPSAGRQRRSNTPSQQHEQVLVTPSVTGKRKRPSALEAPQESQEDELEQNDEEHQASARKGRVESARRKSQRGQATPKTVLEEEEDELEENDVDHTLSTERLRASLGNAGSARAAASQGLFVSQDEPSPLPAAKRPGRPRKSVGGPQAPVAVPPETAATKKPRRSSRAEKIIDELAEEEQEEIEDELSEDELTPAVARRQFEHIEDPDSESASDDAEEESADSEDEVESRASTPEASSSNIPPQPKRRGRPSMAKAPAPVTKPRKAPAAPARPRPRRSSDAPERGARIPVTVYRLSTLRKPTADDDASQIDELELPTPSATTHPRLPTVNAVDILAQITSELTSRMSTSLLEQAAAADKPRRAQLTHRARTVDAFATELADRLFDLTEAVDAGEALRVRAAAANKEKIALRAELLAIRKEREGVALQMDAVRQAHMRAEAQRRREEELSEALWGIETAVQRGREKAGREGREGEGPEVGWAWEVEELVEGGVSGAVGGGLLGRVRAFNGFLERAAGVVEGRS